MSDRFSRRTDWPAGSNRISELADRFRRDGTEWIDLTESNPTRCGLELPGIDWLDALSDPSNLAYTPDPKGLLRAREAVCSYYAAKGVRVDPAQVVLTSGTSEAYHLVLRLLTHPGQAVLTPAPSYPLIDLLLDLNDIRQHRYPLNCDGTDAGPGAGPNGNGWTFNVANARSVRQSQTPALIAIHANNPTGHTFSPAERAAMVEFVRMEKMALIVDEVFLDYSGRPDATFASEEGVLTFTLSGISKVLGLPQMKLSWIVVSGPETERREALRRLEIMADVFLSVNTPAQNALSGWLEHAPEVKSRILERVRTNREILSSAVRGSTALSALPCSGAWTAILRLPDSTDDETFAYDLFNIAKVLAHPGYLFEFPSGSHLVLSLLPPPDRFAEGVRRIVQTFAPDPRTFPSVR